MVNTTEEMDAEPPTDNSSLPNADSMVIDVPNHESKEAELPVYRHLDFSQVKHHRDNFGSFVFHAPMAGTPAAQALEANAAIKVSKVSKGLHKLRGLKRPKLKSLNVVKKMNKTTKVKRDRKHFSTNFKGKVIDGVHELYTLTAGMMLGIRYSIGRNHSTESSHVEIADFSYVEKVFFPPKGNLEPPHITPQHSLAHTFKFKSYCPKVFQRLRDFFGIDAASYMLSVCGDYNFVEFISNSKSGQFFFYSHDGKYMIKTQTKEENKFLKRILPHYYKFLTENPYSMLVQILGMHRVKMYHLRRKVHFVIMRSVFDSPVQIHTIYDLKGSLIGRAATEKERASGGVLKDNDLITDKRTIHLGVKKAAFMDQLEKDAMFLASLNIMDYSLLVGFHDRRKRVNSASVLQANTMSNAAGGVVSAATNAVTSSALKHLSSDSNMNGRSNTPFRRSIHATALPEPADQIEANCVSLSAIDLHAGTFETPIKQPQQQESPSRKLSKRNSASGGDVLNVSNSGSAKENGSARRIRKSMSKSLEASSSDREISTQPTLEVNHSSIDINIADTDDSPKSFGSMYVNRDKSRRFKKTFVRNTNATNGANGHPQVLTHHSSVRHMEVVRRRSTSSSGEEYSGRITDDFIAPDKKRGSRNSSNADANGVAVESSEGEATAGEEGDNEEDEYYDEEDGSYEEEEDDEDDNFDFLDEGDSDLNPDELDDVVDGHESINTVEWAKNIGYSKEHHAIYARQPVVEDGVGAMGPEGGLLHDVWRNSLGSKSGDKKPEYTYGPGATDRKPWTSRKDGGINSRGPTGRGDDIYFLGIIDILQQYNTGKRVETFYKGLTNDKTQISSVDAVSYAKRFVKFMGEHID